MSTQHKWYVSQAALVAVALSLVLSACSGDSKPVKGFVLPEGDIAKGEQVFIDYNCHSCHSIPEKEFPKVEFEVPFVLEIGGEVYRVKNYGELMTSIVNPDHIISGKYRSMLETADRNIEMSPMPDFGNDMSIAELIDLVAFLHAQYSKLQPQYYRGYHLTN